MNIPKKVLLATIVIMTALLVAACGGLFPPDVEEPEVGDEPPVTENGDGAGTGDLTLILSPVHETLGDNCLGCHTDGALIREEKQPNHPLDDTYADCAACHTYEMR
ncbi:hypothetical protein [Desulfuribacillus alkaliarsenatis]|uniref:Uncharacterized protein n=1 Tax=Desulfuribacillus alkaliarsenatis TaxID=766136 RepID=A0A1E5G540_9FIRM|nr:hypothetical protein [Desulfuribacillus alkaliarsenatis]OEF98288.1 hypothetical protein BHF68_01000 [Desulfuribacillus alkaliarsenatis]